MSSVQRYLDNGTWHERTFTQPHEDVDRVATRLRHHTKRCDKVALLAATSPEWTICDLAIARIGAICVPIHPTSTPRQIRWIPEDSAAVAAFADQPGRITTIPVLATEIPDIQPPARATSCSPTSRSKVLARSEGVFNGYDNNREATGETIVDGWLPTGDLGELDGFLTLADRKKDLVFTSAGKNLAPAAIENDLRRTRWITGGTALRPPAVPGGAAERRSGRAAGAGRGRDQHRRPRPAHRRATALGHRP
ncbi:AMP-binding protein [Amycolatopsis sp. NPDC051372]|uniref:AMP-binding protein n=1 Tax=unclassified Amycolatopsis TaxID=2618356 RepID=UPI003448F116